MSFVILSHQQSMVGAILEVPDSINDESTIVLLSEGTSVRIQADFWHLGGMLLAFLGDSWLPSTMTHLWLNI